MISKRFFVTDFLNKNYKYDLQKNILNGSEANLEENLTLEEKKSHKIYPQIQKFPIFSKF
jgi:hypothetical protein